MCVLLSHLTRQAHHDADDNIYYRKKTFQIVDIFDVTKTGMAVPLEPIPLQGSTE